MVLLIARIAGKAILNAAGYALEGERTYSLCEIQSHASIEALRRDLERRTPLWNPCT